MNFPTMAQANGNGHHTSPPWMRDSVRNFFEGIAWTGKARLPLVGSATDGGPGTSPLTLSVYEFFEAVAWNGQPTIAAPIAPLEVPPEPVTEPEDDDLTLDALFG
jgi:hypothetical protein